MIFVTMKKALVVVLSVSEPRGPRCARQHGGLLQLPQKDGRGGGAYEVNFFIFSLVISIVNIYMCFFRIIRVFPYLDLGVEWECEVFSLINSTLYLCRCSFLEWQVHTSSRDIDWPPFIFLFFGFRVLTRVAPSHPLVLKSAQLSQALKRFTAS